MFSLLKFHLSILRKLRTLQSIPWWKAYVRANKAPFTNKKMKKYIMKWSRPRNKFSYFKSDTDGKAYNKGL